MHLYFSQPTSPFAWGHVSAIWDPGGHPLKPHTTIFTPKMSLFSLAASQEAKDQKYSLETAKCTLSSSSHLDRDMGPSIGHLGPWWPPLEPPNNIYFQNEPVFYSRFSKGYGPAILSKLQNTPFFLSTYLTHGMGPCIGHLGP